MSEQVADLETQVELLTGQLTILKDECDRERRLRVVAEATIVILERELDAIGWPKSKREPQ